MKTHLEPGTYIVAVSGGVDSMALLHHLVHDVMPNNEKYRFVVAHYDHGIRSDSHMDRQLVQDIARQYRLPFVYATGSLGAGASEAEARTARYSFLHKARKAAGARAVITAHHQDDALETAVLNLMRGTNRRGLAPLYGYATDVVRPLLHVPKTSLKAYAEQHNISWREDSTNQDLAYKRNYVRHKLLDRLSPEERLEVAYRLASLAELNAYIDAELAHFLHLQTASGKLDRGLFVQLHHAVAKEVMAAWLRSQGVLGYDAKALERLVVAAKTAQNGAKIEVMFGYAMEVSRHFLALKGRDR